MEAQLKKILRAQIYHYPQQGLGTKVDGIRPKQGPHAAVVPPAPHVRQDHACALRTRRGISRHHHIMAADIILRTTTSQAPEGIDY